MPEVAAYQCEYCRKLMIPLEKKDTRWHTKWCSLCGVCVYDVFIGGEDQPQLDVFSPPAV